MKKQHFELTEKYTAFGAQMSAFRFGSVGVGTGNPWWPL
jgi:hypothetical protein